MARIWVFRHAESLSNAGGRTLAPAGIPLTERGATQAEELAQSLAEAPQLILASAFQRSLETAAPILSRFPESRREVWPIQEFTYLSPASCINTTWLERKPRIDQYWLRLDPAHIDGDGAESFSMLLGRVRSFLGRLSDLQIDLAIAISHGQFMQAARLMAGAGNLDDAIAMRMFRELELATPIANCERLEFVARDGAVFGV